MKEVVSILCLWDKRILRRATGYNLLIISSLWRMTDCTLLNMCCMFQNWHVLHTEKYRNKNIPESGLALLGRNFVVHCREIWVVRLNPITEASFNSHLLPRLSSERNAENQSSNVGQKGPWGNFPRKGDRSGERERALNCFQFLEKSN